MTRRSRSEFENSRPFDVHKWSDYPEVNDAVDHIYADVVALGDIKRENPAKTKKYVKILTLDLYVAHVADPTMYISYPRNHNELKNNRYNALFIKPDLLVKAVDWFEALGYIDTKMGYYFPGSKRQSRIRATASLIDLIRGKFALSPLMVTRHEEAETILLRDEKKKLIEYEDTPEVTRMRANLKIINGLLDKTLINIYLPDTELLKLNRRMVSGKIDEEILEDEEIPRGAVDFNRRRLHRVFNNASFDQGGRFYGGWWQGVPREYRKFIKINHLHTEEVDFSGMHINLLYALKEMEMPFEDPYELEGLPNGTRDVVKRSLLTIINAKDRTRAMKSIRRQITTKKIVLPKGIQKVEEVIEPFEAKHEKIKEFFFSGQGVFLQRWDSEIAEEIMLTLASKGIPALPLHDSFIVSFHQERALKLVMQQAYSKVTGKTAKVDNKTSVIAENRKRPKAELEQEQDWKVGGTLELSEDFKQKYHLYYSNTLEWKFITGKNNIFPFNPQRVFNREAYDL